MVCHTAVGCSVIALVTATRQHLPSGMTNLQLSLQADGCYLEQREEVHRNISIGYASEETCLKLSALKGKGCNVCVPSDWDSVDFLQEHQCTFFKLSGEYMFGF